VGERAALARFHVARALERVVGMLWLGSWVLSAGQAAAELPRTRRASTRPSDPRHPLHLRRARWRRLHDRYVHRPLLDWPDRFAERRWHERFEVDGLERLRLALESGPVVLVTLHWGPVALLPSLLRSRGIRAAIVVNDTLWPMSALHTKGWAHANRRSAHESARRPATLPPPIARDRSGTDRRGRLPPRADHRGACPRRPDPALERGLPPGPPGPGDDHAHPHRRAIAVALPDRCRPSAATVPAGGRGRGRGGTADGLGQASSSWTHRTPAIVVRPSTLGWRGGRPESTQEGAPGSRRAAPG